MTETELTSSKRERRSEGQRHCSECGVRLLPENKPTTCSRCVVASLMPKASLPIPPVEGLEWAEAFPHLDLLSAVELDDGVEGYLAEDLEFERSVLLLLVDSTRLGSRSARDRWVQAYRQLSRIHPPHLARVLDFGAIGQQFYAVLERPPGKLLSERAERLLQADLEGVMSQVHEGLAQVEAVGVKLVSHPGLVFVSEENGHPVVIPVWAGLK